jgi:[ribosomal protein S5]-alanine N-acetyltransferase
MISLSQRLSISPFTGIGKIEKIRKQVEWLNDRDVTKYSEQRHKFHTVASQVEYINSFSMPSGFYEIVIDASLNMIGTMSIYIDTPNNVADIGIMIGDKSKWRRGYGSEAWLSVINSLMNKGIRKIEGGCMAENKPMISIFEKSRMNLEGRRSKHCLLDGSPVDWLYFGRFRDETI